MSREQRNKRLMCTQKGADPAQLVPAGYDPYQRTYICSRGWKKRKSRSEGSRPRQHIRHTNCPFRFVVQWNLSRKELEVKHGRYVHNHPVSEQAFATYPSSRRVDDELISARVGGMLAVGACAMLIEPSTPSFNFTKKRSRRLLFVNCNYDEMSNVLRFTTPYVAGQVEEEYALAVDCFEVYTFVRDDGDEHLIRVQGGSKPHEFRDDVWQCNCEFSVSMRLPCRHVIAFHKTGPAIAPVIPWTSIDERNVRQFSYERFSNSEVGGASKTTMAYSQRYTEVLRATQLIASELADIDEDDEFRRMLDFVMQHWRNVRQKTSEIATPLSLSAPDKRKYVPKVKYEDADSVEEKADKEMSSEGDSSEDDLVEELLSTAPTIRLNPKARKVGRPKKPKAKTVASERADRKWFEAAEAGRKTAGDATLERVLVNLGLRVDMTATTLPRRRFELFFCLKTGRLLPLEPLPATGPPGDDDEVKPAPPSQDQNEEQLPATQVAQ
ncbi:hypothetical protein PF006_g9031 [Phytophthora fragariae]|uniref:SWIM-type domain-containing protein n=1 Tax=Phytophthora fragariae TaxID=53985 RepID=A0A6A3U4A2_9STRA|nr:hypothetical protein PF006_g9031 [Phytophthora fragariae]